MKLEDGTIIYSPEDVCAQWGEYFKSLYTPRENDSHNRQFKQYVENQLGSMSEESHSCIDIILGTDIDKYEVNRVINELKMKKAPGFDQITSEHIKYGGERLVTCLTKLFNIINQHEYIPTDFKIGIIIPIPKGSKNRLYQDNHRGITLLPTIAKMYEKIIYHRMLSWARNKKMIHRLQGAEREKCSSLNTAWLIREAIGSTRSE